MSSSSEPARFILPRIEPLTSSHNDGRDTAVSLVSDRLRDATELLTTVNLEYGHDQGRLENEIILAMRDRGESARELLASVQSWRLPWDDVVEDVMPAYDDYLFGQESLEVIARALRAIWFDLRMEYQTYEQLQDSLERVISMAISPDDGFRDDQDSANEEETTECIVCMDSFAKDDILTLRCGDDYCRACINRQFEHSVSDVDTPFPPQCCGKPIKISAARAYLDPAMTARVERMIAEEQTPAQNRLYCASADCGCFMGAVSEAPPVLLLRYPAMCTECKGLTCTRCRRAKHHGDCEAYNAKAELKTLREEARRLGVKNCRACGMAIERVWGCAIMRCKCGHEFCWNCESDWPGCSCFTLDNAGLTLRAAPWDAAMAGFPLGLGARDEGFEGYRGLRWPHGFGGHVPPAQNDRHRAPPAPGFYGWPLPAHQVDRQAQPAQEANDWAHRADAWRRGLDTLPQEFEPRPQHSEASRQPEGRQDHR